MTKKIIKPKWCLNFGTGKHDKNCCYCGKFLVREGMDKSLVNGVIQVGDGLFLHTLCAKCNQKLQTSKKEDKA